MSAEIEPKVAPEIESKSIEVGEWGLTFKNNITLDEWGKALKEVQKYDGKLQWYLGDLVVYADNTGVTGWGEPKYLSLIDATGYDYQTLANYASVARRFPLSFREEILTPGGKTPFLVSFSHFKVVASLKNDDAAKHFLRMVRDSGWTRAKLETEVAKYKNGGTLPVKEELPVGIKTFREQFKNLLVGYIPQQDNQEYDTIHFLTELKDLVEERLQELGVVDV